MTASRNIQIHALTSMVGALPNRGDDQNAKRLVFGDCFRARISSQCLKYYWARYRGPNSIHDILGIRQDVRSRETITRMVIPRVAEQGDYSEELLNAVRDELHVGLYGKNGKELKNRQSILLGLPEIEYIARRTQQICEENPESPDDAARDVRAMIAGERANFMAMLESNRGNQGLRSLVFGRFMTSFEEANVDAPIQVAHAFTVHAEEIELDHFSTVDDLLEGGEGAAYLGQTQVESGIFYLYVVVDVPGLVGNLEGMSRERWLEADRRTAAEAVEKLIMTIATVTPESKRSSTASHSSADLVLVEVGEHQPRTLAEAFRKPVRSAQMDDTLAALSGYLGNKDRMYGRNEARRSVSALRAELPGARDLTSMADLTGWVRRAVELGETGLEDGE